MKYFFVLLTLLIHTSFANAFDQAALMKAFGSIVMVRGYTASGSLAYGSGVIVGKGEVITNCHVLRNTKAPWVSQGEESYPITDVRVDAWRDLCLLNLHNLNRDSVSIGSSKNLVKGQSLMAIGHSSGLPVPLTTGGVVVSTYDYDEGKIILSSAKFRLGASGSGLFDMNGNLIGINTFKPTGYGAYYAMPIDWLSSLRKKEKQQKFLIKGKALWEEDENKKPYFLRIAIPKIKENWNVLLKITKEWVIKENQNSEAWYEHGFVNENLLNTEVALSAYKKSINLDTNNSDSLFRSALLYHKNGNPSKAKEIQKDLLVIDEVRGIELEQLL